MEPGPVWRLPSAVWTNQGRPTLQGDHSRSSWSWSQGCDDRICGRGWGRLQNHCRKQGKAFAGENISGAHIFSSHAIQGPLDTDILREYIKTRSPLNYKWAFSFHSYPKNFRKPCCRVEERIAMRTIHGEQFSSFVSSFSPSLINYLLCLQTQYYVMKKFLCWKYIFILKEKKCTLSQKHKECEIWLTFLFFFFLAPPTNPSVSLHQ